jgi:hypothetical protein
MENLQLEYEVIFDLLFEQAYRLDGIYQEIDQMNPDESHP